MKALKTTLRADLLILLSALLWGGEYVVVKEMVEYLPPNWINAFRFIIAALLMIPLFPRRLLRLSRPEMWAGLLLGFFLFGGFTFQTIGIQYTTAAKSGFITSTYVVIVPFAYWAIRKKYPGVRALIAGVVCAGGIALISLEGQGSGFNKGDLLTLAAAVSFTGSIIGFDYFSKRHDPINLTFVEMLFGGLLSLMLALLFESFPADVHWGTAELMQLLYVVLLGTLFCHLASNIAMKWAESSHASVLWSLESVFALILGALFLGETLNLQIGIGFVLVLGAVLLSELGSAAEDIA